MMPRGSGQGHVRVSSSQDIKKINIEFDTLIIAH